LCKIGGEKMDAEIWKLVATQGIFCVLFVWLFYDTRKEAKAREEKLMEALEQSTSAYTSIVESVDRLEGKIDQHFNQK